eukprot:191258_1
MTWMLMHWKQKKIFTNLSNITKSPSTTKDTIHKSKLIWQHSSLINNSENKYDKNSITTKLTILQIPNNLLVNSILTYLKPKSLKNIRKTCRYFNIQASDPNCVYSINCEDNIGKIDDDFRFAKPKCLIVNGYGDEDAICEKHQNSSSYQCQSCEQCDCCSDILKEAINECGECHQERYNYRHQPNWSNSVKKLCIDSFNDDFYGCVGDGLTFNNLESLSLSYSFNENGNETPNTMDLILNVNCCKTLLELSLNGELLDANILLKCKYLQSLTIYDMKGFIGVPSDISQNEICLNHLKEIHYDFSNKQLNDFL